MLTVGVSKSGSILKLQEPTALSSSKCNLSNDCRVSTPVLPCSYTMAHVIEALVRGAATGIGMASEGYQAYKERKANPDSPSSQPSEDTRDEADEQAWQLDDAQEELLSRDPQAPSGAYGHLSAEAREAIAKNPRQQAELFLARYPPPSAHEPIARIPFPVILPQRRPKDRSRGFVRAYAPVLDDCGIEQAMFLDFIETFDRASQASPWIQTINLATVFTSFLPLTSAIVVSRVINKATDVAIELHARSRSAPFCSRTFQVHSSDVHSTHSFLDNINEDFFRPRGLYCLVMTWNPDSETVQGSVDLSSAVATSLERTFAPGVGKIKHKFSSSDGLAAGDAELPETAPLVYPVLDQLSSQADDKSLSKYAMGKVWLNDYFDRRAQAEHMIHNPDGKLAQGPKPAFKSIYSDPTHPASSGNPWSLITGGRWRPPTVFGVLASGRGLLEEARGGRSGLFGRDSGRSRGDGGISGREGLLGRARGSQSFRGHDDSHLDAGNHQSPSYDQRGQSRTSLLGGRGRSGLLGGGPGGRQGNQGLRKVLQKVRDLPHPCLATTLIILQDVLYLMIVNMPTAEEMQEARVLVDEAAHR
jgi:hypothetical protein